METQTIDSTVGAVTPAIIFGATIPSELRISKIRGYSMGCGSWGCPSKYMCCGTEHGDCDSYDGDTNCGVDCGGGGDDRRHYSQMNDCTTYITRDGFN